MPNIKLITFHTPKNYGAVLQGFSLMSELKKYDPDIRVIDFNTPHLRSIYTLLPNPHSLRGFVKYLLTLPVLEKRRIQFEKFDSFVKEYYPLTKRCECFADITAVSGQTDYFFTGSDQIFNPNRIDEEQRAFYLTFADGDAKCISYAGSFGVAQLPQEKKNKLKQYLERFYRISVREASGKAIVQDLGLPVTEVLDPVFLNDVSFWRQQQRVYTKLPNADFLLYYRLLGNKNGDRFAKKIAKEKNLKLVVISQTFCPPLSSCVLHDVGPQELLYLYDKASFVVTDSFHGVAFSLIYNKPFVFSDDDIRTYERGYHLLEKVGIQDSAFIATYSGKSIPYTVVNQEMNGLVAASKAFIEESLNES